MTQSRKIILESINANLEWSDTKRIADELKVSPNSVSAVRHGRMTSARILDALLNLATKHKEQALKIAEYHNKPVNI